VFGFLLSALASAALLAAAGCIGALACRPRDRAATATDANPSESVEDDPADGPALLLLALGWGFGLVPAAAFFFYLATGAHVGWPTLWPAAAGSIVACLAGWRWRWRGQTVPPLWDPALAASLRHHRVGILAALAVGLLYGLTYEQRAFSALESCIHQMGLVATGALSFADDVLSDRTQDARLGIPAVMSAFLALFQGIGLRLLFALCGGLIALGGYTMALVLGGGRLLGLAALVALALNPYVLKIPLLDENLVALAFSATFVPWLLRGRSPWLLIGLLASLVLGMRHILILALPAWLWAVASGPERRRALPRFLLALFIGTLPYHLHHHLALGSVLRFESFSQLPAFAHDFGVFGTVQWHGLLNWPLHDTLVRTPHMPLPMWAMWPLALLDHFGWLGAGIAGLGLCVGWLRDRRVWLFWLLWFVPAFASLLVQENWDYPNKMFVIVILFWAPLGWLLDGLRAIWRWPTGMAGGVALCGGAMWLLAGSLSDIRAPADTRYIQHFGADATELAELLAHDRRRITEIDFFPDYPRVNDYRAFGSGDSLAQLGHDVANFATAWKTAPWGWHPIEIPDRGKPVVVELDLSRPPWEGQAPLRVVDEVAHVDATTGEGVQLAGPVTVTWDARPLTVFITPPSVPVAGIWLLFGDQRWLLSPPAGDRQHRDRFHDVRGELQWLMLGDGMDDEKQPLWRDARAVPTGGRKLRIRIPGGGVQLVMTAAILSARHLAWRGTVDRGGVKLGPTRRVLRN